MSATAIDRGQSLPQWSKRVCVFCLLQVSQALIDGKSTLAIT
jgi:hypothetical protein